ncbi:peptidoglycan-associated lipoprotein Pal [Allochromatium palmeri]|uniref:Peptidoglycan-associated protein n=1 Tax=Allochromatium palmeri TaxID=231048 RepID=A0A6N8EDV7_9GAMM|nr:peptidoglycan-associated lipoprotein Pal [Allochromatium palmeri]MTW21468.1 peptidoglycan-associated lipoprotein Pal [Allochromatium palmeri]
MAELRIGRLATLAVILLGMNLAGCASKPAPMPPTSMSTPSTLSRETTTAPAVESIRPTYAGPWEDPASPLYERTIYFDYDTAEIKPQYLSVIRTHARYLGNQPGTRVTLEGHTDERGTREYNLALSDQRAESVRRFMLAEGVPANQLATLSYGEERPADPGHSETSWRLNRRVIIQY